MIIHYPPPRPVPGSKREDSCRRNPSHQIGLRKGNRIVTTPFQRKQQIKCEWGWIKKPFLSHGKDFECFHVAIFGINASRWVRSKLDKTQGRYYFDMSQFLITLDQICMFVGWLSSELHGLGGSSHLFSLSSAELWGLKEFLKGKMGQYLHGLTIIGSTRTLYLQRRFPTSNFLGEKGLPGFFAVTNPLKGKRLWAHCLRGYRLPW